MNLKDCEYIIYSVQEDPDTIIYGGVCKFMLDGVYSEDILNPTWRQAALWAEETIKERDDYHHVFLEGAQVTYTIPFRPYKDFVYIGLHMGS